jgi:hypothetical protein
VALNAANIPAALVGGRMDANVGAMGANVMTAAAIATGAIDADALATDAGAKIADAICDELLAGHTTAGSLGDALTRSLGLAQHNHVLRGLTFNGDGNLTDATLRLYDTAANAGTDDGSTGLLGAYTVTNTYSGTSLTKATIAKAS